jgi:hypothetical protein
MIKNQEPTRRTSICVGRPFYQWISMPDNIPGKFFIDIKGLENLSFDTLEEAKNYLREKELRELRINSAPLPSEEKPQRPTMSL